MDRYLPKTYTHTAGVSNQLTPGMATFSVTDCSEGISPTLCDKESKATKPLVFGTSSHLLWESWTCRAPSVFVTWEQLFWGPVTCAEYLAKFKMGEICGFQCLTLNPARLPMYYCVVGFGRPKFMDLLWVWEFPKAWTGGWSPFWGAQYGKVEHQFPTNQTSAFDTNRVF